MRPQKNPEAFNFGIFLYAMQHKEIRPVTSPGNKNRLCHRKRLMLFSLKFQKNNRQNALAVDSAKGKAGEKAVVSPRCGDETAPCTAKPENRPNTLKREGTAARTGRGKVKDRDMPSTKAFPRMLHVRRPLPARWLGPARGKGAGSLRPRSSPSCAWRTRHG